MNLEENVQKCNVNWEDQNRWGPIPEMLCWYKCEGCAVKHQWSEIDSVTQYKCKFRSIFWEIIITWIYFAIVCHTEWSCLVSQLAFIRYNYKISWKYNVHNHKWKYVKHSEVQVLGNGE